MTTPEQLYQRGRSLEEQGKLQDAQQCILRAAKLGYAEAQNMLGRYLEEGWAGTKNLPAATAWYRKAADQGLAVAQCNYAHSLHEGIGVAKDRRAAYPWFRKSAEQGYVPAQNMVGRYLEEGWSGEKNPAEAAAWYRRAAEQGNFKAQYNLAYMLQEGNGVPRDYREAYIWFFKAAEQGYAEAQNMVGRYLEEGWASAKNLPVAATWYRKAADQGLAVAQHNYALLLNYGNGVEKDRSKAYAWFRKSAEQGYAPAQNMVGRYFEEGWAVGKNPIEAVAWYRKSADQGYYKAQYNLAYSLQEGNGVPKDYREAYIWYFKAAEQGNADAQNMVGRFLEEGWASAKNLPAAATWYRKAADQGLAAAQYNYAHLLEEGIGVAEDKREACLWYRKAADQGMDDARKALERLQSQLTKNDPRPDSGSPSTPGASQPTSRSSAPASKPTAPSSSSGDEVDRLLNELDALTGLNAVKREIRKRVASVRLSKLRGDGRGHGSLHMVFSGNPGTGKTTVARLVGKIYHALGLVENGDLFMECSREDLVSNHIGETAIFVKDQVEKALGGILFIDEAYSLYVPGSDRDFGTEAIDTLVKAMEDHRDNLVVIMAGYTEEMRTMIKEANPGLASRFRTWVEFEDYSPDELFQIAKKMIADRDREMGPGVEDALRELIAERCRDKGFGNARGVRNLLDDVQDVMDERLAGRLAYGVALGDAELRTIERVDVEQLMKRPSGKKHEAESLEDLLAELDSLTGLESAKRSVRYRVAEVRIAAQAKKAGTTVATGASSLHMVFAGNPGTGKTTVARLVGRIYHCLGIVRDPDRFVECRRENLVGSYIGQTAPKVNEQVEKALGGVLFIDEAYSLYAPKSENDFGTEAIDTLVALMENHRDDLVVIMAGYTDEMRAMIDGANPGLKSRFRTWIEFEDYTADELLSIFEGMAAKRGLRLAAGCRPKVADVIAYRNSLGNFGNARGVRNLLDDIVERMVLRLVDEGDRAEREGWKLPKEEFETIREPDIPPVPPFDCR